MKLAIMQPYFFPYLGYFQLVNAVDTFYLYDNLEYSSGGWVNRNRVLRVGGPDISISVQIEDRKATKPIRDVALVADQRWRNRLVRTIELNYGRSPYFDDVYPLVESIIEFKTASLAELNKRSVVDICSYLGMNTRILTDSTPFDDLEHTLSHSESLTAAFPHIEIDRPEKKVVRVLEICRRFEADVFVNAIGGQNLYAKDTFRRNGVLLYFIQMDSIDYPQRSVDRFYPHLSIIDVLMNCGRDETAGLLEQYQLI